MGTNMLTPPALGLMKTTLLFSPLLLFSPKLTMLCYPPPWTGYLPQPNIIREGRTCFRRRPRTEAKDNIRSEYIMVDDTTLRKCPSLPEQKVRGKNPTVYIQLGWLAWELLSADLKGASLAKISGEMNIPYKILVQLRDRPGHLLEKDLLWKVIVGLNESVEYFKFVEYSIQGEYIRIN